MRAGLLAAFLGIGLVAQGAPARAADELGDFRELLRDVRGGRDLDDRDRQRAEDALQMCGERARREVRDAGGRDVSYERLRDVEVRDDRVRIEATMSARVDGDDNKGSIRCEASFEGENRITGFNEDGLTDRRRGSRDSGRDESGRRADAVDACRREARNDGYDVRDAEVADEDREGIRVDMDLRRRGDSDPHGEPQR